MEEILNDGEYVVRFYSTLYRSWNIHKLGTNREKAVEIYNTFKNGAENINGIAYPYINVELFKLTATKEVV